MCKDAFKRLMSKIDDIKKKLGAQTIDMGFQRIEIDLNRFENQPNTEALPILPTRNLVQFPGVTVTFELGRPSSLDLAVEANKSGTPIGIICQIDPEEDEPSLTTGLYKYGVAADVLAIFDRPDGVKCALVRARDRFRVMGKAAGVENQLCARIKLLADIEPDGSFEYATACQEIRRVALECMNKQQNNELKNAIQGIDDDGTLINFLCTNLPIDIPDKVALLSKTKLSDRATGLLSQLYLMTERMAVTEDIMKKAKMSMDENQKNAFLQQQMDAIRETLYGDVDEADELLAQGEKAEMPADVWKLFQKEVEKLRRYNPSSPDYSVLYSYLDTLVNIPWKKQTTVNKNFGKAEEILEGDHYGLEKVKERILEQMALIMHNPKGRAPIICLVGAPGVGKTSIGRSVANALGRKYERVSFGGLHDEAEIRGHRRTYIGAMPGRIIDAMKRAQVNNPVLLLDELDKIGADYKGDPAAALLEVLDPEQNCHFHDNYIDVDYDLSNVLFIATANTLSTIARPLLDRMEIIEIPGYLVEEKMEIAKRHLLPRICEQNKIGKGELNISDEAIEAIIRNYTSESGVRALEKKLSAVARKLVLAKMKKQEFPEVVKPEHLYDILGLAPHIPDRYEGNEFAGVVTGLAWTEVGGEILQAESSLSAAKTPTLTLTGKLGDVMKDSATLADQWVRSHAKDMKIDPALFEKYSLHIHFPEGAVPKDGPSAGITIVTSIVSTFRQTKVAPRIAMTGEMTLRGKVLPVGGIREKILAAKRAGITDIIMSEANRRDIEDIPTAYVDGITFHYVDTVQEVIALAVTDEPVANPLPLSAE